jgi:hypothetical protein
VKSVAEFVATPPEAYGVPVLIEGLEIAAAVELATIPPYCCGLWSITDDPSTLPTQWIRQIHFQEMLHLGLVCNMTTAIGGTPALVPPVYPGPLPGGVRPELIVTLQGLSDDYVRSVFMGIEYPEDGPATPPGTATIGQLYDTLQNMFDLVDPPFVGGTQQEADIAGNKLTAITDLADVTAAITVIKEQGEGTATSPDSDPEGDLAHYYLFGQIANEAMFVETDGTWGYTGAAVPFPTAAPMAPVPPGGWVGVAPAVEALLAEFSTAYAAVLGGLNAAWSPTGTDADLQKAIGSMFGLGSPAQQLMAIAVPGGGGGTYGPDFVLRT